MEADFQPFSTPSFTSPRKGSDRRTEGPVDSLCLVVKTVFQQGDGLILVREPRSRAYSQKAKNINRRNIVTYFNKDF